MSSPEKRTRSSKRAQAPDGTSGKEPPRTRASHEGRQQDSHHGISREQRTAKAAEGAGKYLDGHFGPEGGHGALKRAAAWVKSELNGPQEWSPARLNNYISKERDKRRASGTYEPTRVRFSGWLQRVG